MRRVVAFALFLPAIASAQTDLRIPGTGQTVVGYGRILPIGDSLTVGVGFVGGWRRMLQEQLTREGVQYQFVGRYDPYTPMKQPYHEGHPSWTSKMILEGIPGTANGNLRDWLRQHRPDTIILMVGTNDSEAQPMNHTLILDEIFRQYPKARVVVGLVPPVGGSPSRQAAVTQTRAAQAEAVKQFAAKGFAVDAADLSGLNVQTMLNADKVHPNEAGYRYMTNAYRASLKRLWGF